MTHMPIRDRTFAGGEDRPRSAPFIDSQRNKPLKAMIGLMVLIVCALVLSRIDHAPHDIVPLPAATADHTAGSLSR